MNNIEEFEIAYNKYTGRDTSAPVERLKHPVPGITYKYQYANDMLAFWNAARAGLIAQLEASQKELFDFHNQEFQQRLANSEHQLYMKDLAIHNIKASRKAQFRKRLAAEAALSAANERTLAPVILEIANERLRQISVEGWTPEHDDQHSSGELAGAAGCYAKHVNARQWCFKNNPDDYQCEPEPSGWPWAAEWWKPKNPRSDLIRAAALIVAELERLDRAAGFTVEGE
ncbi:hypothetical protein ACS8AQ_23955 [Yersinia enterocolitica]|uniref:hypothetical protein n=1 Tax=Yersinia enterocolitica TaxID=630 RepID=UPI003F4743D2